MFKIHYWDSWIRTNASGSQSPLPYHLAISQKYNSASAVNEAVWFKQTTSLGRSAIFSRWLVPHRLMDRNSHPAIAPCRYRVAIFWHKLLGDLAIVQLISYFCVVLCPCTVDTPKGHDSSRIRTCNPRIKSPVLYRTELSRLNMAPSTLLVPYVGEPYNQQVFERPSSTVRRTLFLVFII